MERSDVFLDFILITRFPAIHHEDDDDAEQGIVARKQLSLISTEIEFETGSNNNKELLDHMKRWYRT